jgi:hypothetical protein
MGTRRRRYFTGKSNFLIVHGDWLKFNQSKTREKQDM